MGAKVVRLRTQRERMTREAAASLADQLRLFSDSDVPKVVREQLLNALQRLTIPDDETAIWPGGFFMLSKRQTALVWDAIRKLPSELRPNQTRHAFDLVMLNLRHDTGEVMLTRDQFAEQMDTDPDNVTRVMATLEKMGVIRRERRRIEGVRGRGIVVYFINPHVGWTGSLEVRREEAKHESPPLLTLMQGGR